ncbi:hypothetical protein [Nostoc sp.]|uniref:hypothetical protein n=1 Tax=Nostoc sp. TaxID=1180 RepID=UPI002FF6E228
MIIWWKNEWQVRPLTKLDPDNQPEAWQQAVESVNRKVPSHRIVKECGAKDYETHPSTQYLPNR